MIKFEYISTASLLRSHTSQGFDRIVLRILFSRVRMLLLLLLRRALRSIELVAYVRDGAYTCHSEPWPWQAKDGVGTGSRRVSIFGTVISTVLSTFHGLPDAMHDTPVPFS